jgi:hypothetical protein
VSALREGDVESLRDLLAADASIIGDGGGKAPQLARSICRRRQCGPGACLDLPWLVSIDVTLEPHKVNGQPGAIFRDRDGKVLYTLALDVLDGRIQTIRSVSNPDKLRHVGRVADAWAVAREVNQARRPRILTGRAADPDRRGGAAEGFPGNRRRRAEASQVAAYAAGPERHWPPSESGA